MIGLTEKSILRTLIYSDIFDYPLKADEILRFLITNKQKNNQFKDFNKLASHLSSGKLNILSKKSLFYLKGREEIINKRLEREKESKRKLEIAKKVSSLLSIIPSVQLLGISGGLSMKNSDKDDDIDFFIISSKNKLWATRFLIIILLKIIGRHRKKLSKEIKDKICLNFLIDESAISFSKDRQDLYNAHEIVQLIPLFERNNMYKKFLNANMWVSEHLPNTVHKRIKSNKAQNLTESIFGVILRLVLLSSALEYLSKKLQLYVMNKTNKTNEVITNHILAFHTKDYRKKVLSLYKKRLKQYKLL